jgi:molybdenum cofactor biosynthesis protein MoaC
MFSHINAVGRAVMVNVVTKQPTVRTAIAKADILVPKNVFDAVQKNIITKGDVISVSRIAGITGSKRTADLIPLCHNINIDFVSVDITPMDGNKFEVVSEVHTFNKTGVEMEALTAVHVSCLTFYDMCKAISKDIVINNIRLINKTGGKKVT